MTKKQITLMIASVLVFALFLGLTSAILTTTTMPTLAQEGNNFTFDLTNNESTAENIVIDVATIIEDDQTITFITKSLSIPANETITVTVNYLISTGFDFLLGQEYTTTMTIESNSVDYPNLTRNLAFEKTTFCEDCTNEGDLDIDSIEINVLNGFGDDEDYWYPLDEIEVEFDVENKGEWDIRKIEIEWALYNTAGEKIMDGTEDEFKLDYGDDITTTFTFILDEDLDKFEGEDAILYLKAKGEIDDNSANDKDGMDTCASDSIEVTVNSGDDFVIATEFEMNGVEVEDDFYDSLSCGEEVTITGKLWNIGDTDQDDVELQIYNNALGINEIIKFNEVQSFDYEEFSYTFAVPGEMEEKTYDISFEVYDEDNDLFENSEDDEAITDLFVKIEGSCVFVEPTITAVLDSEAKAGTEMIVKATITNSGEEQMILTLNVDQFEEWATLTSVNPGVVVLEAGQSQDVMITLKLNKDSEGEHTFEITASLDDEVVQTGSLFVTVEKSSFDFKNLFDKIDLKLALIILINLVLVIAIIIVAVRVARRK